MKKQWLSIFTLTLFCSNALAETFKVDPQHSSIAFKISHLGLSEVSGRYDTYTATFDYDEKKNEIKNVKFVIQANSINTHVTDRDNHLKSKDFFEVEKYKTIEFTSSKTLKLDADSEGKLPGVLKIRNVSKPVTFEVEYTKAIVDPWGKRRLGFKGETEINRKDFGIVWNKQLDHGGVMVGDTVELSIDGEATSESPAK